jgi:hypothetical protein
MRTAIAVTTLLLALPLTACGQDDPAVCGSADDLRASVDDVKKVDLTASDALADLQSALTAVEDDFADLKADAKSEFSASVDAVESSLTAVKTSLEDVQTTPSKQSVSAAGSALTTLGSKVETLLDDVKSTC